MSNLSQSQSSLSTIVGKQIIQNSSATPYDQKVSRENPACFVFLVDQSGSNNFINIFLQISTNYLSTNDKIKY